MRAAGVAADGGVERAVLEGIGGGADRGVGVLGRGEDEAAMDVEIKDKEKRMDTKLNEFKNGVPADVSAIARDRDNYDIRKQFLREYNTLILNDSDCNWDHTEPESGGKTPVELGNFITVRAGFYSGWQIAEWLAYDAFKSFKTLRKEGKLTAVKSKPELKIGDIKDDMVSYAWYAEIYS